MAVIVTVGLATLTIGCRPESVTGARDRLSGGEARTVTYRLPVAREAYGATDFLKGATTISLDGGLLGVPALPDTIRILVGDALRDSGRVTFEAFERFGPESLDLDELASVVAAAELRTAPIELALSHNSAASLRVLDPALALIRTGPSGDPVRDDSGDLVVIQDTDGDSLVVPVADSLTVSPGERVDLRPDGAPLVDRLVEQIVAGESATVALTGSARVPDEQRDRVDSDDQLQLAHRVLVGLDLVLPDSGVVIRRQEIGEGLGFSPQSADEIQNRLIKGGARLLVTNDIPFRVRVHLAYASGRRREGNVFEAPDGVLIDSLEVGGSPSGAAGIATDTLEVALSGEQLRPLLGDTFTAGVRIRLLPASGTGGRGALRNGEMVEVDAGVFAEVRSGRGSP